MSEFRKGSLQRRRKNSNSSVSSKSSIVSFSEDVRRETTAKFDNFMKECRAAYLAVLASTTENITSEEELSLALQFGGRNPSKKVLQKYWKVETDSIPYGTFCDIMRKEKPATKESLLRAFKKIDVNGDGYITHNELSRMLTMRGERMTKAEVQAILDEADDNGDGRLDYNEFCKMLVSTAEECKAKSLQKLEKTVAQKKFAMTQKGLGTKANGGSPVGSPLGTKSSQRLLEEPKNLKNWHASQSKGCFHIDQDGTISSHQYRLEVTRDTQVWLTIHSTASKTAPENLRLMDLGVFIVDNKRSELMAFTESRLDMKYCLLCDLKRGSYDLFTFTSGCQLALAKQPRSGKEAKLTKGSVDNLKLTKAFKEVLSEIFNRCDLDGNGYLSRTEFDLFQMRCSGEHCDDDAWEVMIENFEMHNGEEITLKGFLDLNQMEAKDMEGDPDDLWVTLECMGYDRSLELNQACPFFLEAFAKGCQPSLEVTKVDNAGEPLNNALEASVLSNSSNTEKIRGMKDLVLYRYDCASRTTLVIENESHSDVYVRVDCSASRNCISHRGDLQYTVLSTARNAEVAHHLVPKDPTREFSVKYSLNIQK